MVTRPTFFCLFWINRSSAILGQKNRPPPKCLENDGITGDLKYSPGDPLSPRRVGLQGQLHTLFFFVSCCLFEINFFCILYIFNTQFYYWTFFIYFFCFFPLMFLFCIFLLQFVCHSLYQFWFSSFFFFSNFRVWIVVVLLTRICCPPLRHCTTQRPHCLTPRRLSRAPGSHWLATRSD